MTTTTLLTVFFGALAIAAITVTGHFIKKNKSLKEEIALTKSKKKATEVRTGMIVEQLGPISKLFPYDPMKCQFLGRPIDYVVFTEDEVVFLEIKTGQSALNASQKNIKKNIENKKVRFEILRIK